TNQAGIPVNQGVVTFQVNGETLTAPVSNGFATATFATPMLSLDMTILLDDVFTHTLDAVYSDSSGVFGSGASYVSEAAMFLDYLFYLQSLQFGALGLQLPQLQSL
ncbi:MAG TPA: hypothetical protein VMF69_03130, partial [Gemmataceae bacterium]|nr:hypothetical protein [Gemmataceae bacterium]